MILFKAGDVAVGVHYTVGKGAVIARVTSEPWALVFVDGVGKGRTPAALPPMSSGATQIELKIPPERSVQFTLSVELAP